MANNPANYPPNSSPNSVETSWRELDRKCARDTKQIVARLPDDDEAG
jgi:hypothetical protein